MKRLLTIILVTYVFFLAEFILFSLLGRWGKPDLVLIFLIFINLYLGIRYSLMTAVFAGVLYDGFGLTPLGTHVFIFMACALLATLIRHNFYQPGSRLSRAVVVFWTTAAFLVLRMGLASLSTEVMFPAAMTHIVLPEMVTTMLVVTFVFEKLKHLSAKIGL